MTDDGTSEPQRSEPRKKTEPKSRKDRSRTGQVNILKLDLKVPFDSNCSTDNLYGLF